MELKDIPGFEGLYKISKNGDVFNMKSNRFLKHHIGRGGYPAVHLSKDKRIYHKYIHRLVAETYIPNPEGYKFINHKDENKLNCNIGNLEWCTRTYNNTYKGIHKRRGIKISHTIKAKGGAWNKGLKMENVHDEQKSGEIKRKISEARKSQGFQGNQYVDADGKRK